MYVYFCVRTIHLHLFFTIYICEFRGFVILKFLKINYYFNSNELMIILNLYKKYKNMFDLSHRVPISVTFKGYYKL